MKTSGRVGIFCGFDNAHGMFVIANNNAFTVCIIVDDNAHRVCIIGHLSRFLSHLLPHH